MRFTLEPGGDVEVPDGATLAGCRPGLVRLTGDAGLAGATVSIDGLVLTDDQVAGVPPWLPGSRVWIGIGPPDPTAQATTAPWHVAVVAGPDAGRIAVPGRDGRVRIDRDAPPDGSRGHLAVGDPTVSREHVRVHRRRRRAGRPARWRVVDVGSVNGTVHLRPPAVRARPAAGAVDLDRSAPPREARRVRSVGARGVVLRAGDLLTLGSTTIAVRRLDDVGTADTLGSRPTDGSGRDAARDGPGPSIAGWLMPAVASAGLAVATRNPVFLVLAMSGPLTIGLPAAVRAARRIRTADGRSGRAPTSTPGAAAEVGGPDRTGLRTVPRPVAEPHGTADPPPVVDLGPDPALTSLLLAMSARRRPTEQAEGTLVRDGPVRAVPLPWWRFAQEGLAVVGARPDALAVVRALAGAALLDGSLHLSLLHERAAGPEWAWGRWLDARIGAGPERWVGRDPAGAARVLGRTSRRPILLICDRGAAWRVALNRWWVTDRRAGTGVVLVEDTPTTVPGWCRWVLRVQPGQEPGGIGLPAVLDGPGGPCAVEVPTAPAGWIDEHARRVAARDGHGRDARSPGLPSQVALADLGLPADPPALLRAWGAGPAGLVTRRLPGLVTTIGVGPAGAGPVTLDLLAEGPHALVAGTTGAGKSELLQSLVLSLALRHPPTELAVVLVDYKGGASFGPCKDLPHVVGQVTDLDPVAAARALDGLRAELRRREHLLAAAGATDLESLRATAAGPTGGVAPPRLLVVVDEFRALTEDLADFVPGLVRLAAQGRSLGIHLVLATQRPAGAVSAQMRANVALRICLRVTDAADSTDVVEVADAAALPVDRPGRALVRRGPAAPELIQSAWAALPPGRHPAPGDEPTVRWAARWDEHVDAERAGDGPEGGPPRTGDHAEHLVRLVRAAAVAAGVCAPAAVWLPPLPAAIRSQDVAAAAGPPRGPLPVAGPPGLLLGLADLPADQARGVLRWDWRGGGLVVAGRSGSGRTTTLRTLAHAALAQGLHVHAIGLVTERVHPGVGTLVGVDDPRRMARLLRLLSTGRHEPSCLLVVDDAGAALRALDRLPRGAGADLLEQTLRDGRHHGLAVAVAGVPTDLARLLAHAADRVVLAVGDPHDDAVLGVPRDVSAGRGTPGRGVHVSAAGAVRCQVALPADLGPPTPTPVAPLRLEPLPVRVPRPAVAVTGTGLGTGLVALGRGGDDAGPVTIDLATGALVVGPPASGRSTALATMAATLHQAGWQVWVVARDGPLAELGPPIVSGRATGLAEARTLLDRLGATAATGRAVLVDDLELVGRADPALDELLAAWVGAAEAGDRSVPRVIGSVRTDRAATAYRGAAAALRTAVPLLVLAPLTPGSHDVAGTDLSRAVDPDHPTRPGLGVVVDRGRVTPVQVAGPGPAAPGW